MNETKKKYPVNKPLRFSAFGYLILVLLFIFAQELFPAGKNDWSNSLIIFIFWLGSGICFLIMGMILSYYSWTLTEYEFLEWWLSQRVSENKLAREWNSAFYELLCWSFRFIGGPVSILAGLGITGFVLFQCVMFLFR